MVRNLLKCALIGAMITGGTGMAIARDSEIAKAHGIREVVTDSYVKLNARYGQYFGQYDEGGKEDSVHYKNFGEIGIQFSGGAGNARFFVDSEMRSGPQEWEYFDVLGRASYITPIGIVTIGKVSNYIAQYEIDAGGGIKAGNGLFGSQNVSTFAGVVEDDGVDFALPLMDRKLVFELTYWDTAGVKFRSESVERGRKGQSDKGSTFAAGVYFNGGPIKLKAGVTNEAMNDYDDDSDETGFNTYNLFSGQVAIGIIKLTLSASNADVELFNKYLAMDSDRRAEVSTQISTYTAMLTGLGATYDTLEKIATAYPSEMKFDVRSICLEVDKLGPGRLNLNYDIMTLKDKTHLATATETGSAQAAVITNGVLTNLDQTQELVTTSIIYSIDITEKIGYQLLYNAKAETPDGGDTTTETFIGGGLYGFF